MQRFHFIFLLIYLPISVVCHGQSSVGVSPSGYLTSLPPEIPSLEYPSDSARNLPLEIDLQWQPQTHTSSYSLQVSKESDFSVLVIDQTNHSDTVFSVSGLENNTTYFWRVSASNVAGESDHSSVWEFTTIVALPSTPELAEPTDHADDIPIETELKWYTSENAESYSLHVSKLSDFSALVIDQANHSDTVFSVTGLENNTTYFWRVSASNVAGESDYSSVWEFTTIMALPNTPILAEPADYAVDVPIETELKWYTSENAETYSLQVSNLSDFSALVIDQTNHLDTVFSVSGLENNTTYYWRVSASNIAGESNHSSIWNFTTVTATAIEWGNGSKTDGFGIQRAYPNPFNTNTVIEYSLPGQTNVLIVIYNSMGQSILELESGKKQAGEHIVIWNGRDSSGASVNNGIYLFMLQTDYGILTQRILFIR